jgi:hypothetical protein
VYEQLAPLRERGWLTHWNGTNRVNRPITVVGSGNTPFELLIANETYRDIFFDAPLEALVDPSDAHPASVSANNSVAGKARVFKYNPSNSHFASVKFEEAVGMLWNGELSRAQIGILRTQSKQARMRGLIPRYWGTPRWPRGLRDQIWTVLVKEDIGLLNVDDLRAVRKGHWGFWPQGGGRQHKLGR